MAECAKCHVGAMMAQWDSDVCRPVPPVLIDCGSQFGLVPSVIVWSKPVADDPEPGLWNAEQELVAEEEQRHQMREAAARVADEEDRRRKEAANVSRPIRTYRRDAF